MTIILSPPHQTEIASDMKSVIEVKKFEKHVHYHVFYKFKSLSWALRPVRFVIFPLFMLIKLIALAALRQQ